MIGAMWRARAGPAIIPLGFLKIQLAAHVGLACPRRALSPDKKPRAGRSEP